jgi:hypothetical protein
MANSARRPLQLVSLRQALVPSHRPGKMNTSYRFFASGSTPSGALLAGLLGPLIGLRPAPAVFLRILAIHPAVGLPLSVARYSPITHTRRSRTCS